jgi:hypothetical protein
MYQVGDLKMEHKAEEEEVWAGEEDSAAKVCRKDFKCLKGWNFPPVVEAEVVDSVAAPVAEVVPVVSAAAPVEQAALAVVVSAVPVVPEVKVQQVLAAKLVQGLVRTSKPIYVSTMKIFMKAG